MPFVDETDPLPSRLEPTGRWAVPYLSDRSGLWTVFTRRPLTYREIKAGLSSFVNAVNREGLKAAMDREDERAGEVANDSGSVPAWSHRA